MDLPLPGIITKLKIIKIYMNILNGFQALRINRNWDMGKELGSEYYNKVFRDGGCNRIYHRIPQETVWWPVWNRISEEINNDGTLRVLDLGCGPGQFAKCLSSFSVDSYLGLDFSSEALGIARQNIKNSPQSDKFIFRECDLLKTKINTLNYDYNVIVSTEFLEHINEDLKILEEIKAGTHVFATFPDEDSAGHVRYYSSDKENACREIKERYEGLFEITYIEEWAYANNKKRDWLAKMIRI